MADPDVEVAPGGDDGDALPVDELGDTLGPGAVLDDGAEQAAARLEAEAAAQLPDDSMLEQETLKLPPDLQDTAAFKTSKSLGENMRTARIEQNAKRFEWKEVGESIKPDHLKVPAGAREIVDRLSQPHRLDPRDIVPSPPRHSHGPLEPKSIVDPTVVRSFVHRIDKNKDDLVDPLELSEISLKRNMGITDAQIMQMFERIINARPSGKRNCAGISWGEIYNEMKVEKSWMKTLDLSVTCDDGEHYHVATEPETLQSWCRSMQAKFLADYPGLEAPSSLSTEVIESYMAKLLSLKNSKTGRFLQSELSVQKLLTPQTVGQPRPITSVTVAGERQAWGWKAASPYRDLWLRFFRAVGLKPLMPAEIESGKTAKKIDEAELVKKAPVPSPNVVTAAPAPKSKVTKEGQVQIRNPKPKVLAREGQEPSTRHVSFDAVAAPHHEDKRMHAESLVNTAISKSASQPILVDGDAPKSASSSRRSTGLGGGHPSGSASAPSLVLDDTRKSDAPHFSFDAKVRFQQVTAKHGRDSEQQQSIGKDKQELKRQASLLGAAGQSVANVGITFKGPHQHLGFSTHHLTNSVEPSRMEYDPEIAHFWDGTYVDHSRMPPVKEDAKLSKMNAEERARQFGCYFPKPDCQAARVNALDGVKHNMGGYKPWQNHEFRHDHPNRHGKFGRRVFETLVRPAQPGALVSAIESKPIEEYVRQQDLLHEFLDRSLPAGQHKHFEQYLPKSEMPYRKEVDTMGRYLTGPGNHIWT